MLRQLRIAAFRTDPREGQRDDKVLVIGESQSDPQLYAPLPGAADEARAVADVIGRETAVLK
jgi:hypothetical protein